MDCGPLGFQETFKEHLRSVGIPGPFIRSELLTPSPESTSDVESATVLLTRPNKTTMWGQEYSSTPETGRINLSCPLAAVYEHVRAMLHR